MSNPTRFGRYSIERALGAGGLGKVYLARDPQLDRLVALKVMTAATDSEDGLLARFRREAECIARLSHPGVVRIYDSGIEDRTPYIAMEYVEGNTLQAFLKTSGPMDVRSATQLIRELLDAAAACHAAGLVHRDIKPGNVMIEPSGRVRLLDLGLAKAVDLTLLTTPGQFLGTPRYLAPEMLSGPEVDARADIYQIGLIFYECLEGRAAYDAPTLRELTIQIARTGPRALSRALAPGETWVRDFLARALARSPAERFQTAVEASQFIEQHSVVARQRQASRPVPRSPSRGAATPALARRSRGPALLAAVLVLFVGLWFSFRSRPATVASSVVTPVATTSVVAASVAPERARPVREVVQRFVDVFRPLKLLDVFDTLRSEFREGKTDPVSRKALRGLWQARFKTMFEPALRRSAFAELSAVLPRIATDPSLPPEERSALLRQLSWFADLRALVTQAFPGSWSLPSLDAEMPGLQVERTEPPGLTRLLSAAVPAPAGFNTVELDLATVTGGIGPVRWDHVVMVPGAGRRPPRRAYVAYRVAGASTTGKLVVRVAPQPSGRLGCEAAVVRGGRDGAPEEGFVRIDERLLAGPERALTMHFEYYSVIWVCPNMRLERFDLLVEPAAAEP